MDDTFLIGCWIFIAAGMIAPDPRATPWCYGAACMLALIGVITT